MRIIYEDSDILVCCKEAGLAVQSARIGTKDLVSILKTRLWESSGGKGEPYLGIVHRLDQPVEGILVFAKTPRAAAELSAQVTDGRMKKTYLAAVHLLRGQTAPAGTLEDYLLKDGRTNRSGVVSKGTKGAKAARLDYRILEQAAVADGETAQKDPGKHGETEQKDPGKRGETAQKDPGKHGTSDTALVRIRLHTGRHHQIRVQMAHAGMPLLGDQKYGLPGEDGQLALCAVSLELYHPKTGKLMRFWCEPEGAYFARWKTRITAEERESADKKGFEGSACGQL